MKDLEQLHLVLALRTLKPVQASKLPTIHLPVLRVVQLEYEAIEDYLRFFEPVSFSPSVRLSIASLSTTPPSHDYHFFRLEVNNVSQPHEMYIDRIGIALDPLTPVPLDVGFNVSANLDGNASWPVEVLHNNLITFVQSLPTADLRYLVLAGTNFGKIDSLLTIFTSMSSLNTLCIEEAWSRPMITALTQLIPICTRIDTHTYSFNLSDCIESTCIPCKAIAETYFPKLRSMAFVATGGPKGRKISSRHTKQLRRFLLYCYLGGHKLERLEIRGLEQPDIDAPQFSVLAELSDEVVYSDA
ncbi:hypothetical protein AX16_002801 [Volvariella volvacea WC 439]|nr:hypothetical protein AX16_002801 [Volvariella volvacea WC 439]